MATVTFDTLAAAEQPESADIDTRQARAIGGIIRDGGEAGASRADLTAAIAGLKAEIFRALWIQGLGRVGAFTALMGVDVAIIQLL